MLAGLAAPAARLSVKITISLAAFQNIGFVCLDNVLELRGFLVLCAQKPMSPTKRGGDRKIAALCRRLNRQPISDALRKGEPTYPSCEGPAKLCQLLR